MLSLRKRGVLAAAPAVLALAAAAGTANADAVLTFGFTDLNASYDGAGSFSATVNDTVNFAAAGDVTRVGDPDGATALYEAGFSNALTDAMVAVDMSLSNILPGSADVNVGTITVTDADGDTITANLSGSWQSIDAGGGFTFLAFAGSLSNVFINDNNDQDGTFDGPTGGLFSLDFAPLEQPFVGAIVQLFLSPSGVSFNDSFSNISTQVSGEIVTVPGPGALALAAIGTFGMIGPRRRRGC